MNIDRSRGNAMKERIEQLLKDWHEAGRTRFEKSYPNLDYDTYAPKSMKDKAKYIYLDDGDSGAFILEKDNGIIYRLKSKYGVPNKRKVCGNIATITGGDLDRLRWW